ncbi:hypothetical protein C0J52_09261 [Blattella germanica]|nr:hypothetical protein C0J52_09261 [Blattella germanica]
MRNLHNIYSEMSSLWKHTFQRSYSLYNHVRSFCMNATLNPLFHWSNSTHYSCSSLCSKLKLESLTIQKVNFSLGNYLYRQNNFDDLDDEIDPDAEQYEDLVRRMFHLPEMGHQVLVIQPYVKWGVSKKRNTNPDLQLSEAVALVDTLKNWKVVDKIKISLNSLDKKALFGTGNLETLKKQIQKNKQVTAVFISVNLLRGIQLRELENKFGLPVYDRYMLVIQIFREHAISREAKLQVALAEILYLRKRIRALSEGKSEHQGAGLAAVGGAGETSLEMRKRILNDRESKIKNKIDKLRNHRILLRNRRKKLEYPVVAVVGYTNAGKTSLIKALTGENTMNPQDQLFATLDVTTHAGFLPCQLKVLFVDTVGFISDIPTNLIESFMATLEDAMQAVSTALQFEIMLKLKSF